MSSKTPFILARSAVFVLSLFCLCPVYATEVDTKELTQSIENIQLTHTVAAAAVLLVSQDEILLNLHSGVRDWHTKQSFSSKDMYRIGSISKSFAGVLALRLQQKGLINLNDSIADYGLTPYLKNTYPDRTITLAHLLEHTAGLADLSQAEWDYNDAKPISLKQAFDLKLGHHNPHWPPGIHRSYSNVGAGLFGLALEIKLGQTYESLMQKHVFEPLNMSHSGLLLTTEVQKHLITGYDRDGKKPIKYWHNIYRPFAAINTNNQEMIRWLQMLLNQDDAFLNQADRQRLQQPTTTLAAQHGMSYGYGLGVYQWQTQGYSFYGHGGDADGYLTRFGFNPESGLAYFVMINAFNHQPLNQIVKLLEQQISGTLPKPEYPDRLQLSRKQVQNFIGHYQQATVRFAGKKNSTGATLKLETRGNKLFYSYNKGPTTAIYKVKDNQFRTVNDSVATITFVEYQGKIYFQGPLGNFIKTSITQAP